MATKRRNSGIKPAPVWLTSYGDMTTLLLTFFVYMFTMAQIQGHEFRLILSAFQGAMGMLQGGQTLTKGKLEDLGMTIEKLPSLERGRRLGKARQKAMQIFQPELKSRKVRIQEDERGIVITLTSDAYFEPGNADINLEDTKDVLDKVTELICGIDNLVRVEGHTDNTPIHNEEFASNWELSSQRAINVLKYIVNKGKQLGADEKQLSSRLSAVGYGEYRPLVGNYNRTPEERAQNRRVEIIILWEMFGTKE